MPQIFKVLATITAWILFISACITWLMTTLNWAVIIGFIGRPGPDAWAGWGLAAVTFVLAVVVMILRKKME
jgi:hypothetical protein